MCTRGCHLCLQQELHTAEHQFVIVAAAEYVQHLHELANLRPHSPSPSMRAQDGDADSEALAIHNFTRKLITHIINYSLSQ